MGLTVQEKNALIAQRKAAAGVADVSAPIILPPNPTEAADTAAITATGPMDAALTTAGGVGETISSPAALRMMQSLASPSVSFPLVTGLVVGAKTRNPELTRKATTAASAVGTSFENWANGTGVFSFENAKDVGINSALTYFGDMAAEKLTAGISGKIGALKDRIRSKAIGVTTDGAVDVHAIGKRLATDAANDISNVVAEGGIPLTPDDVRRATKGLFTAPELMESQTLDQAEAFVKGSFVGSAAIRGMSLLRSKTFEAAKTAYKRAIGPYVDDAGKLGKLLSSKVDEFASGVTEYTSAQHQFLDELAGDTPVDLSSVVGKADPVIAAMEKLKGTYPSIQGVDSIVGTLKNLQRKVNATLPVRIGANGLPVAPPATTFNWREAKRMRTGFREARQALEKAGASSGAAEAGAAEASLSKVMEEALDNTTPVDMAGRTARQVWKRANGRTKDMVDLTQRAQLDAVIDLADEKNLGAQVIDKLSPKLGNSDNIKTVRRLLGGAKSESWQKLQRWRVEGLLNSNTPARALSLLTDVQQSGAGPAAYRELLGDHYGKIADLLRAQVFAAQKNPAGSKVGTHLIENGLMLSLPASVMTGPLGMASAAGTAATWVVGMRQLSKWMTSPKTADMVIGLVRSGNRPSPFLLKQLARAVEQGIAEGAIGQDEFIPMPKTATREGLKAKNSAGFGPNPGRTNYSGSRG